MFSSFQICFVLDNGILRHTFGPLGGGGVINSRKTLLVSFLAPTHIHGTTPNCDLWLLRMLWYLSQGITKQLPLFHHFPPLLWEQQQEFHVRHIEVDEGLQYQYSDG